MTSPILMLSLTPPVTSPSKNTKLFAHKLQLSYDAEAYAFVTAKHQTFTKKVG